MAEAGPPLGTVLGNIGINALKFCKEFNDYTKELPSYFVLKTKIIIMEDRSYTFSVFLPTTGYILSIIKYQRIIKVHFKEIKENLISLKTLVQLAKFKFPNMSLLCSVRIILGSVNSSNIFISF